MSSLLSSFQLTEDQGLFLIQFITQNADLLPAQCQNLPSLLANQRRLRPSNDRTYLDRVRDLERREREVARRERELELRELVPSPDLGPIRDRDTPPNLEDCNHEDSSQKQDDDQGLTLDVTLDGDDVNLPHNVPYPKSMSDVSAERLRVPDADDGILSPDVAHEERDNNSCPSQTFTHNERDKRDVTGERHQRERDERHQRERDVTGERPQRLERDNERDAALKDLHNVLDPCARDSWEDQDLNSDQDGTLVESDFTDKWFQAQAEDFDSERPLVSVEVWLAEQVGGLSSSDDQDSPTGEGPSRKRNISDSNSESGAQGVIGRGGKGERGGGGDPGHPARGACGRGGQNVAASKRHKTAHGSFTEEEEVEAEEEENIGNSGGDQENPDPTARNLWAVSDKPATASQDVRNSAMLLLLEIGMGEGTWIQSQECTAWIQNLQQAVAVTPWEDIESLQGNNLACLTQRLLRVEALDAGLTFLRMMTELMFAAKINSILHHKRLLQKESGQVQKASLRPILGKLIRDQKLQLSSLLRWYSAGSRWGRLASGGTVYILMVIARKSGLAAKLKGKRVTSTTIIELSNMLRYPNSPDMAEILSDHLVPLITKVAEVIPLNFPTLFHKKVREYYRLSKAINCWNLEENDKYFDLFFQHTAMALPRLSSFWKTFCDLSSGDIESFKLERMTRAYLAGDSGKNLSDCYSLDSDSEDEQDDMSSNLPIYVDNFNVGEENVNLLHSTYSYNNSAAGKPTPFPKTKRQNWTDKHRCGAEQAIEVNTLEELAQRMRTRYYDESEVVDRDQVGSLKHSQKWLQVTNSLINGQEIKVLDSDQKLMFYTNRTLSESERRRLLVSLMALFSTKPAGVSLVERSKERPGKNTFTTFHFSTWGRYGQNDLQVHSEEYALLCEILGEILEKIVQKVLRYFPQCLQEVEANVDIFPLNDTSPVKPFTSFVLNVNVQTIWGVILEEGCVCSNQEWYLT
ncbi:hypothetical protein C8R42DRAFT_647105 [Lentinula raphanica]|nr:hypothetical protein C8R42DRAFT_647105 [Lentinula raphanica]